MSRATHDAAAAAEIRFFFVDYATRGATTFAQRNADRVMSLGYYGAPNFDSIRTYSQLKDLNVTLGVDVAKIALLPRSLTKLEVSLHTVRIDWENFRPLCCLQELKVYNQEDKSDIGVQLDDSFATALSLLKVFHLTPGLRFVASETTAKVVMPHLVELKIYHVKNVHLDLHFMSALKTLILAGCTLSTVSAACSTLILHNCQMREGTVLKIPNLRSLTINGEGLHKLDGTRCRHALSIVCKVGCIEWVGAKPNVDNLRKVLC